jgi:hypothetical protein
LQHNQTWLTENIGRVHINKKGEYMSISLDRGTAPKGTEVRTRIGLFGAIHLGEIEMTLEDFACFTYYVMVTEDLTGPDDPRLQLLKSLQEMEKVQSMNVGKERLDSEVSPII